MTIIKHTLPEYKEISILPLADLHMGDINCDFKRVMEWIDYVKNTPDAFCILNGDLMDAAIKSSIVDADIYIHSHVHTPAIVRNAFFRTCPGNNSVEKVEKLFVNTGATLEYGGYGEVQNYKPASFETPIIVLDGSKRRMRAVL